MQDSTIRPLCDCEGCDSKPHARPCGAPALDYDVQESASAGRPVYFCPACSPARLWMCGDCGAENVPVAHFVLCQPDATYYDPDAQNARCARHLGDMTVEFISSESERIRDGGESCDLCPEAGAPHLYGNGSADPYPANRGRRG